MTDDAIANLTLETEPDLDDIAVLDERLYEFNSNTTGIFDGELYGIFLRDNDGNVIGGVDGWTWGAACYVKHLFIPEALRRQGLGTKLMDRVEQEARARDCALIVLETHDFQAPEFYRRRGFVVAGSVEGYPRGHHSFTMVKSLRG